MFAFLRRSVMARVLATGAVALVTSGSQLSCNGGEGMVRIEDPPLPPPEAVDTRFTTLLVLRDSAGAERYAFQPGELITFEITVRNRTTQPATVSFTGYTGSVDVFNNGSNDSLWNPFDDLVFAQVVQTSTFAAGESQVFTHTWNQLLPTGSNLPLGIYEARGLYNARVTLGGPNGTPVEDRDLMSTLRQFTIR
jgi:Intracellular proteinase inhibitor